MSRKAMERRRIEAIELFRKGYNANRVACMLGVSRTSAGRWRDALRTAGPAAALLRKATGRPPRLTEEQIAELRQVCASGRWTAARMSDEIYRRTGIVFHPDHVGRLLHRWRREQLGGAA